MRWRIKEIFSPKYNTTLYIIQKKGWLFWHDFTYREYSNCIEPRHYMGNDFHLVSAMPDTLVGCKSIEAAKQMIEYYKEYCDIVEKHEIALNEAKKKGQQIKPRFIEVD